MSNKKTESPSQEVELKDCTFIYPVRLSRPTSIQIWNPRVEQGTRMFIDFGGVPKLVLRSTDLEYLRHIPYHCVRDFTVK